MYLLISQILFIGGISKANISKIYLFIKSLYLATCKASSAGLYGGA